MFAIRCVALALPFLAACGMAHAVPSFARQTGFECVQCHLSWPELTAVGRQFKLGGYTLMKETKEARPWLPTSKDGPPPRLPLAAMLQGSWTATRSTAGADDFAHDRDLELQQASLFFAGRIAEHLGAFAQWTYDGVAHHSAIDNVDMRLAGHFAREGGFDVAFGLTLNNNPTVSDIYNSTPAWSFPFASSSVAAAPNAATLIDGGLGQQVAGAGVYALWQNTLYTEVAGYRTADGALSFLRAGTDKSEDAVLRGTAPYWRVALQRTWADGRHSAMIGTFGLDARKFPDSVDPAGPTDRFTDVGFDAQYQYITDRHRFSAQASFIDERQHLDASFASGAASNRSNRLHAVKAKATYYFDAKYGATIGYFDTGGDTDATLYATGSPVTGSVTGSPRTNGFVFEANWLPRRDIRLTLQYTAYQRFNGARSDYDGFGRNASDNNTLFLLGWLMF